MATLEELKAKVDINDLADHLGVKRQGKVSNGNAVYHSPHRKDAKASLSVYEEGRKWKDHTSGDGGTCIDFVMYVEGIEEVGEAAKRVHELAGIPMEQYKPAGAQPRRESTKIDYIADKCLEHAERCREYLESRGILAPVIDAAIKRKTLGFNDWTNSKVAAGQPMHGGPAVAFIVRTLNPGHVAAVDMRYLNAELNGGVKTTCQGEKAGYAWTSDIKRLERAETVYLVESPINALSVESAFGWPEVSGFVAAVATRGVATVDSIDWRFLRGKKVRICMDHQDKLDEHEQRPGLRAAWRLHEVLTGLDVAALLVDQAAWDEGTDVNDRLKSEGADKLRSALRSIEPWLIPGLPSDIKLPGKRRIFLPAHDFAGYGKYRVEDDFTRFIDRWIEADDADEDGKKERSPVFSDLAGFRVASISRVSIASPTSTMTGEEDASPLVLFAVSVQTPRHGSKLIRRVFEDEALHNVEKWKKLGPVFNQSAFLRMVNILERSAHIGARHAANFVGLAWKDRKPIVNEGNDCYFSEPEKQCPYHNLTFPNGTVQDARRVVEAYQATFTENAATIPLVWGLGGHLKAFLGFWPHYAMQASKGSGKSTFIKKLEATLAFTMFSGQSLQTEFRLLTSISHTSHPVGWEELSARKQEIIDRAVALLQESYQYTYTTRGSDMTRYLLSAPVMLAGEDVEGPAKSLIGKLVRSKLSKERQGALLPDDLPRFPVRQWLEWIAKLSKAEVMGHFRRMEDFCLARSRAAGEDAGAARMASNYAAVATAWKLMCEWLELDPKKGDFHRDLLTVMNEHIKETGGARHPWVWILEKLFSEMAMGEFRFPFEWDEIEGRECLLVRPAHVVDYMSRTPALREFWSGLQVKSDRVFKSQLRDAKAVLLDEKGVVREFERTLGAEPFPGQADHRKRVAHLVAIDLTRLGEFGVHAVTSGRLGQSTLFPPGPPSE